MNSKQVRPAWVLVATAMGFFMASLDVTVVNVALASMERSLGASLSGLAWIVDGYNLAFASLLLLGGSVSDRLGARRTLLWSLAAFVIASALCAVAPSTTALVAARVAQGAGAAFFMPASMSLLAAAYPEPAARARAIGIWGAIVSVAAASGPFIGGLLVEFAGWPSIFLVNVPIGVVALALSVAVIPASRPGAQSRLAVFRHVLAVAALSFVSTAVIEGESLGWRSNAVGLLLGGFIITAGLFITLEVSDGGAVLPLDLYANRRFSAALVLGFLINFAFFGALFALSLLLQKVRGATPLQTGLQLLPMTAVMGVGNLVSNQAVRRFGERRVMGVGLVTCAVGAALVAIDGPLSPFVVFGLSLLLIGGGVSVAVAAVISVVMTQAPAAQTGAAAASLNVSRQVGGLLGVAATAAIVAAGVDLGEGLSWALASAAAGYVIAAAIAVRLRPAQSTVGSTAPISFEGPA